MVWLSNRKWKHLIKVFSTNMELVLFQFAHPISNPFRTFPPKINCFVTQKVDFTWDQKENQVFLGNLIGCVKFYRPLFIVQCSLLMTYPWLQCFNLKPMKTQTGSPHSIGVSRILNETGSRNRNRDRAIDLCLVDLFGNLCMILLLLLHWT